jgi:hypothetical protein
MCFLGILSCFVEWNYHYLFISPNFKEQMLRLIHSFYRYISCSYKSKKTIYLGKVTFYVLEPVHKFIEFWVYPDCALLVSWVLNNWVIVRTQSSFLYVWPCLPWAK